MERQDLPKTLEEYAIMSWEELKAENKRLMLENLELNNAVRDMNHVLENMGSHLEVRKSVSGENEFYITTKDYIYNTYDKAIFYEMLDCFGLKLPADEIDDGYQE